MSYSLNGYDNVHGFKCVPVRLGVIACNVGDLFQGQMIMKSLFTRDKAFNSLFGALYVELDSMCDHV